MTRLAGLLTILTFLCFTYVTHASFIPSDTSSVGSSDRIIKRHQGHSHGSGHSHGDLDCTSMGVDEYSIKNQFISLFVILFVGGLGAFIPVIGHQFKALKLPSSILTFGKFFGIGVILSTAVIHIYASAQGFLSDECVSGKMGDYESWAGVLLIASIFLMQFIDFVVLKKTATDQAQVEQRINEDTKGDNNDESAHIHTSAASHAHLHSHNHSHTHMFATSDNTKSGYTSSKSVISTIVLEIGILFHSVIIGLTLGLTPSPSLLTFAIAIGFHQLFEGLAVGDRLSCAYTEHIAKFGGVSKKKLLLMFLGSFAYSISTPIGQIIGISVHSVLNLKSPTYLILLGVLEAISAGTLIYVALIHLISEEFSTQQFWVSSNARKAFCFLSMYFGAAAMALIGKWA
ncbi:hypothetical protein BB560_000057 [Smittium megazygosporum]|uniref:Urease accessory protein UreH-like transmembrane domain-containing protein n=1 Tax=Smittium megazygosporum TaxID=133381 RepID=A0A2T9ZLI7_9FUNG|nr:hypothetical protein BB560_000057 [Smittium megazygosporum]